MLHFHLPVSRESQGGALRNLDLQPYQPTLPDTSDFELYVGDNLLDTPDGRVREAIALLAAELVPAIG